MKTQGKVVPAIDNQSNMGGALQAQQGQPHGVGRVAVASAGTGRQFNGYMLLVVDESQALLQTAQAMFAGSHWQCQTRNDSVSALCAIVELRPQTVLIDVDIAPLDAWKFCLLVKEHPEFSQVKIVLLCRQDDMLTRARAKAAGADAILVKPFTAEEVQAVLER